VLVDWQVEEKVGIFIARAKFVIPKSVAGGYPESRKKPYLTG